MEISVLHHERAFQVQTALYAGPCLRYELDMPAEFRRLLIQTCMQRPGRHIEKRKEPSSGVAANTEHERIPKKVPTRMNGPPNDTFAHNFKSFDGQPGFGRIPDDDAYLRLRIEHFDVGNVARNAVFQTVGGLQTENETRCSGDLNAGTQKAQSEAKKAQKKRPCGILNPLHSPTIFEYTDRATPGSSVPLIMARPSVNKVIS